MTQDFETYDRDTTLQSHHAKQHILCNVQLFLLREVYNRAQNMRNTLAEADEPVEELVENTPSTSVSGIE